LSARFVLLTVGRSRSTWASSAVEEWSVRLKRAGGFSEESVRAEPFRDDADAVRNAEAERLLAKVGPRDRLVALDERGDRLDTKAFAALVDAGRQAGGRLVFAIGGPYGHGDAVRRAAHRVVRLSDLVLNHEVARVVLVEQLYRAITLIEGGPYHH
jgi:23S rRNA (pseudouridine1915-N3)-methyltransferase